MTQIWNRRMLVKKGLIFGSMSLVGENLQAESIVHDRADHHRSAMDHLIGLARRELKEGRMPFAALIVDAQGQWIADGVNAVAQSMDPSDHAEMAAIRKACKKQGQPSLAGTSCYALCHPCPMCMSALMLAQVRHLYFVVDIPEKNAVMTQLNAGIDYYRELAKPFQQRQTRGWQVLEERERVIQILKDWNQTFKK